MVTASVLAATTRDMLATVGRQRVPIAPPACPATAFRGTPMTASLSARHPVRVTPLAPAAPAVLTSLI